MLTHLFLISGGFWEIIPFCFPSFTTFQLHESPTTAPFGELELSFSRIYAYKEEWVFEVFVSISSPPSSYPLLQSLHPMS